MYLFQMNHEISTCKFFRTLFANSIPLTIFTSSWSERNSSIFHTFFFRTQYENGDYKDYYDDIKNLIKWGWEVGLHTDPSSIDDINKIKKEKTNLEKITN